MTNKETLKLMCPYGALLIPERSMMALFNRYYCPIGESGDNKELDESKLDWVKCNKDISNINPSYPTCYVAAINAPDETEVPTSTSAHAPFVGCTIMHFLFYEDSDNYRVGLPTLNIATLASYIGRLVHFGDVVGNTELEKYALKFSVD